MQDIRQRLDQGDLIIIDGGTGTEMEKRGARMEEKGWSASCTLTQPELLRGIHEDYIRAGAEVIITNTFATVKYVMENCGLAEQFEAVNAAACRIAREARDHTADQPVYIAGSMSTITFWTEKPEAAVLRQNCNRQAEILAEGGVDCLILEMMHEIWDTQIALDAGLRTGLPVLIGYCTEVDERGTVWLRGKRETLAEAVQALPAGATPLVAIMHTLTKDIGPSMAALKPHWSGPIGVYPHWGEFKMPHWQFTDMISPADYAAEAAQWVAQGAQLIGGCCGIGPEHIDALRARFAGM